MILFAGVVWPMKGAVNPLPGSRPMFSMMSISPHAGQPRRGEVRPPSIQKRRATCLAPWGWWMRASNFPYFWAKSFLGLQPGRGCNSRENAIGPSEFFQEGR